MRKPTINMLLALLLAGGLAACDESSVVGPDDGLEQTILEALVDEDLSDAILADVEAAFAGVASAPAPTGGALFAEPDPDAVDDARALLEQAREKFRQARQAWIRGERAEAAALAEEARLLVAEALVMVFGDEAYFRLLERVDHIITWLEENVDEESSELLDRIRALKTSAEALYQDYVVSGLDSDLIAATEQLLLAVHLGFRERVHHRRHEMVMHARHSFFMASLALQLVEEVTVGEFTPEQQRVYNHAQYLLASAGLALEAERYRLSLALSHGVVNLCLVILMLDPDLPDNGILAMIEVSDIAIDAAEAAVADLPADAFLVRLLDYVKLLQTRAIQISDTQPRRAVHILWHVSLTAQAIVEMASVT
ncbi:MAG: hypothetical protein JSV86_12625 [Gemmatimonadota bacterium]|nr:MAG: hypothetical protein JSV86_12625 [Gemmatimonadota bacterium]